MADDQSDDLDVESDARDEGSSDPDEGKTSDELKAELAKARAALTRANREAERARLARKAEREKRDAEKEKGASDDAKVGEAIRAAHGVAIRTAGAAALLEAGFTGDRKAARELTKLIDMDSLKMDGDDVDGLDDAVAELRERFPALFRSDEDERSRRPRRVETKVNGSGRSEGTTGKSTAELIGARLRGGR